MKSIIFTLLCLIFTVNSTFSQDIITKKSSEDISSKVLEVTATEIKYKIFNNPDGPIYSLPKSEVLLIRYENGTKDFFYEEPKTEYVSTSVLSTPVISKTDLFLKGQVDAITHYKGYKGATTGTFITSLLSPLVGLVPAIACSSTKPSEANLNYPNEDLMQDLNYAKGYTQKSKKIKQGKVWGKWGLAFGINLALALVLSSK